MAKRTLNRRASREVAVQTETVALADPGTEGSPQKRKANSPAVPRVKKARAKKAPLRLRARWVVFDGTMKQVAIFDYSQRMAAEKKLTDMRAKTKGSYFMQIVKEPMPEPEPAEATGNA